MATRFDDDFAQVSFSGIELMAVIQALTTECEMLERNKMGAARLNRMRLRENYAIWQQLARSAQEICRLALQTAEEAAGPQPGPPSRQPRSSPELVASTRSVTKTMVVEFVRRYGNLMTGPMPSREAVRVAQRDLEQLEPEGRC